MSNIAGKVYAMNVITPIKWYWRLINRIIFWIAPKTWFGDLLKGLETLSLIHYARWAIVTPGSFPRLDKKQPRETIKYSYMFFFSNFNGSWEQYVDSFHMAIPTGLNLFWFKDVKFPGSVPLQPFHNYISFNQIWTNHYYTAYPMATSNDVKAAQRIKSNLIDFMTESKGLSADEFKKKYDALILKRQNDISIMKPTPIVSLAAAEVEKRRKQDE